MHRRRPDAYSTAARCPRCGTGPASSRGPHRRAGRRRPPASPTRDGRVPAAHVGRRPGPRRRNRSSSTSTATRASRIESAVVKEGGAGPFWLVTVAHEITQRGERARHRGTGPRVPRRRGPRAARPRSREDPHRRPNGSRTRRRPRAAVPVLGASRTTRTGSTTTIRTPRASRATPTSWSTDRSPRSCSPSSPAVTPAATCTTSLPGPRPAFRQQALLAHRPRRRRRHRPHRRDPRRPPRGHDARGTLTQAPR